MLLYMLSFILLSDANSKEIDVKNICMEQFPFIEAYLLTNEKCITLNNINNNNDFEIICYIFTHKFIIPKYTINKNIHNQDEYLENIDIGVINLYPQFSSTHVKTPKYIKYLKKYKDYFHIISKLSNVHIILDLANQLSSNYLCFVYYCYSVWYAYLNQCNVLNLYIRNHINEINWSILCLDENIDLSFFKEHIDKINWPNLCSNENIDEDFYKNYISLFDSECWINISKNKNISEKFYECYINYIYWPCICCRQDISAEFFTKHIDHIKKSNEICYKYLCKYKNTK